MNAYEKWQRNGCCQPCRLRGVTGFLFWTRRHEDLLMNNMFANFLERSFSGTHFEGGRCRLAIAVDGRNTGKDGVLHLSASCCHSTLYIAQNEKPGDIAILGGVKRRHSILILQRCVALRARTLRPYTGGQKHTCRNLANCSKYEKCAGKRIVNNPV